MTTTAASSPSSRTSTPECEEPRFRAASKPVTTTAVRSDTRRDLFVHVGSFPTDYYIATGIQRPVAERSPTSVGGTSMDRIGTRDAPGRGPRGTWWRWAVVGVWTVTGVVALVEVVGRPSLLPALCLAAAVVSVVFLLRSRQAGTVAAFVGTLRAAAEGRWKPVDPAVAAADPELAASASLLIDRFREASLVLARSAQVLSAGGAGIEGVSEEMSSTAESTAARTASAATTAE